MDSKSYNNLTALKVQYKLAQAIFINLRKADLRGEIQMIPESAYKSSASKNWEILWKHKL